MATAFDSTNAFNLAETAAVATINGDTWLGDTDNVATVHQKIRGGADPWTLYRYAHELPAIGVLAMGGGADDRQTIGEFVEVIRLGFDVWAVGADFDAADAVCKQIVSRLRRLLRLQTFSPTVEAESSQLDTFASNGDIENQEYDFEYFPSDEGGYLVHGVTYCLITILSEE